MNDDEGQHWAQMQAEAEAAEAEASMAAEAEYRMQMEAIMDNRAANIWNLAGFLYETYCHAVGGVAFNGDKLPTWEEFKADASKGKQVLAWCAVAEASIDKTTKPSERVGEVTEELKPCPFCGGSEIKVVQYEYTCPIEHVEKWGGHVCCTNCGAQTDHDLDTLRDAKESWNTRTTPQE